MKIFSLFFCILLFSCGPKEVSYNYPDNPDYVRKSRAKNLFSDGDLVVYGKKKDPTKTEAKDLAVLGGSAKSAMAQSKLWKPSVEVISALFPIAILNADSGIIATEWYQEPSSNERIKISALIKGNEVKKENLHITIFRQKKSLTKSAGWEGVSRESSDSNGLSAKLLQEKILEKAKEK